MTTPEPNTRSCRARRYRYAKVGACSALVTDARPFYTGISFVETCLHDVDARHTATAHVVGDGGMSALEPGRGLMPNASPATPSTPTSA